MKISYNWLKEYTNLPLNPEEISILLTDTGLEVDGMEIYESIKGGLKGLVVGEVLSCEKHPDADKLSLTTVHIGNQLILPIVCGAPNVQKGQKVIVATIGTELYAGEEPFTIKKSKIRGKESEGMICAEDEIGVGSGHDGILVLPENSPVGMPACEYFKVTQDICIEIGLTPNRSDATSHIGVARDLVAAYNVRNNQNQKIQYPSVEHFLVTNDALPIEVSIEDTEACPRYSGLTIKGVKVGPSPEWLEHKLKAVGIRPINNIVDATNFVMMEMGQPLHAFDYAKIKGQKIIVKKANEGEKFLCLDSVERTLSASNLMICNESENMAIAGVFGGLDSGVTTNTVDLFLESAYFNAVSVRKTARFHGLNTDASFRYERGCDPNITIYALKRVALLIQEIAGGVVSSDIIDHYPTPIEPKKVLIHLKQVRSLIGKEIPEDILLNILKELEMEFRCVEEDCWEVCVPTNKVDVYREADITEEILRIYGYNNIELTGRLQYSINTLKKPDPEAIQELISNFLTAQGASEIMNNSLVNQQNVLKCLKVDEDELTPIANPLSMELNCMRPSLLLGGLSSISYNINRKIENIKFYEFGKTYKKNKDAQDTDSVTKKYNEEHRLGIWISGDLFPESWQKHQPISSNFYYIKGLVRSILTMLRIDLNKLQEENIQDSVLTQGLSYSLNTKEIARFGKVSKSTCNFFGIKQDVFFADINWDLALKHTNPNPVQYQEISKFPEVRRDLALLVDEQITFGQIEKIAFKSEKTLLKQVNLFDVYQGKNLAEGKKSYAVSFILQDKDKTLTDKQIDKIMEKITKNICDELHASLR